MKYDTSIYRGVFCALNAIYDENDNINTNAIKALVAKYKQLGVNGIYACGSTGEGFLLSTEERISNIDCSFFEMRYHVSGCITDTIAYFM